jgi:NADH-quinone oxidoreductase subunit H
MLLIPFFIFIFSKFFLLLFIYFNYDSLFFIQSLISIYWFFLIVFALIAVAFATLTERKVLAGVQRRRGPNVVGVFGFLQAIADGLKLVLKESIIPQKSNRAIFYLSSLFAFIVSFFSWGFIPFTNSGAFLDVNLGLLFILGLSSLHVYSVILSGWSSNSLYAFLGALRSSAQMISYEVGLTLFVLIVYLPVGSLNLIDIVLFQENNVWFILPFFPVAILYFIGMLAELNRTPFDLTEAESELVSGYNVEYSSLLFAFFFLGEYSNILFMLSLIHI